MKYSLVSRCLLSIVGLVFGISQVSAQINAQEITQDLQRVITEMKLPGMAVVLVNKKGVIYKHAFGKADIAENKSYSLNTIQEIGSVSKMILAVALMKAIELGYFSLETDINRILPFKVTNPYEANRAITIRELATHTSGIIDNPSVYINTYQFHLQRRPYSQSYTVPLKELGYQRTLSDSTLKQFYFNYLAKQGKYYTSKNFIHSPSGKTSSYSNIATALIAYLIEIKSGLSYKAFTNRYIFKPLHMTHSAWFTTEIKLSKLAQLYHDSDIIFPLYDLVTYPDGGLKTNASDLSKFLIDVINGLSGKSIILKRQSFQTMFTPQFSSRNLPAKLSLTTRNKGILWNLYNNGTIGHDGDDPGVSSFLVFNPATGLGGLFLCNKYIDDKSFITDIITKHITR
ncbi:serine hydrolase domain-containing protein [Olivibacter sp. CPCC 100613]|uniref:serine hydrolase domain-containing protein n=1 Tax=Olivibacter sp. CPCC 100613 TaxID=3079931 RepID=UPI002FFACE1E